MYNKTLVYGVLGIIISVTYLPAQRLYAPGRLIVHINNEFEGLQYFRGPDGFIRTGLSTLDSLNVSNQCITIEKVYKGPNPIIKGLYQFSFPENTDMIRTAAIYMHNPYIESAIPDYMMPVAQLLPDDDLISDEMDRGLGLIEADDAWEIETGSSDINIIILDTGVDYAHPDMGQNMWQNLGEDADSDGKVLQWNASSGEWEFDPGDINYDDDDDNGYDDDFVGYDFYSNDNDPNHSVNYKTHGTQVAATAAEVGNNEIGGVGVAWNASIMAAKIGAGDYVTIGNAIEAMEYAIENGANIANMSFGTTYSGYINFKDILDSAYENYNMLLVAAAMNANHETKWYPAAWDNVMAVAAVDLNDIKQDISNYGDWISVSAPHDDCQAYYWYPEPDPHRYICGRNATSTASPYVAGLGVLVWSVSPSSSNAVVRSIIESTADNIDEANQGEDWEGKLGSGRINAYRAVLSTKYDIQQWLTGTVSGIISQNTLLYGDVNVPANIVVNSGVNLVVEAGTNVSFASGKKLQINGTLIAEGTSSNRINFTRSGASGTWYGIKFENSSVDASCIVKYADIKHASYGIYCYHASPRIENNDISSCTLGIYAYYQNPRIKNNKIHNNTSNGVQLYYVSKHTDNLRNNSIYSNGNYGFYNYRGNTYLADNLIYYNDSHGIYTYLACLWMDGRDYDNGYAHNVVAYNSGYGVHTLHTTEQYGYDDEGEEGQNSFYGNNTYELYGSCGTGEAEAQWWGTTEEEEIEEIVICVDSYWNWLMSDPNPPISPPLPKSIAVSDGRGSSHSGFNPDCPEQASSPADSSLKELWRQTRRFKKEGNYSQALEILNQIIRDYSNSFVAENALLGLKSVFEAMRINDEAAIASLESIAEQYPGIELSAAALEATIGYLVDAGNSEEAIARCKEVITKYPTTTVNRDARFHLWNIYWYDQENTDKAAAILEEYLKIYGDDDLSVDMRLQMGLISPEEAVIIQRNLRGAEQIAKRTLDEEDTPVEFSLHNNYPNPFNPFTTIRYDLPEDTHVSLVIYDILGRELVRLVDGWIASGYQNVVWNGKDKHGREIPTGIYIARLVTPAATRSIKLVLLR